MVRKAPTIESGWIKYTTAHPCYQFGSICYMPLPVRIWPTENVLIPKLFILIVVIVYISISLTAELELWERCIVWNINSQLPFRPLVTKDHAVLLMLTLWILLPDSKPEALKVSQSTPHFIPSPIWPITPREDSLESRHNTKEQISLLVDRLNTDSTESIWCHLSNVDF